MRVLPVLSLLAIGMFAAGCSDTTPTPVAPPAKVAKTAPVKAPVPVAPVEKLSPAEEASRNLEAKYPVLTVLSMDQVQGTDLFEVRTQEWGLRTMGYTNKTIDYVFVNDRLFIGEGSGLVDYTTKSLNDLTYRLLSQLPYDQALTYTYGAGERAIVVFEDPDCPQCQQFEEDLAKAGPSLNLTVRVLPLPLTQIHPQADAKWRHILCSANPEAAWNEWMTTPIARQSWDLFAQKHPADPTCARASSVDKVLDLAEQLGLNQTPVVLFDNGMTFNGRPTIEELEKSFELIARANAEGVGVKPPTESETAAPSEPKPPVAAEPMVPAVPLPAPPAN